jgi:hypothetical protein
MLLKGFRLLICKCYRGDQLAAKYITKIEARKRSTQATFRTISGRWGLVKAEKWTTVDGVTAIATEWTTVTWRGVKLAAGYNVLSHGTAINATLVKSETGSYRFRVHEIVRHIKLSVVERLPTMKRGDGCNPPNELGRPRGPTNVLMLFARAYASGGCLKISSDPDATCSSWP